MTDPTQPDDSTGDAQQLAVQAAAAIARRSGVAAHDVAVVLGSGWADAATVIAAGAAVSADISLAELPGFAVPTAVGHGGSVSSVGIGGHRVLIFRGRTHLYEGLGVDPVVHAVRTAAAAGCNAMVLTNAAGGLNPDYRVGMPVLISDHLNMTGRSPLVGANFVDLTDLYSARLRSVARQVQPELPDGVYAAMPGPHFETPAEITMLGRLGADLVGMSTVLEAIAARAAGMQVLAISLVSNLAAGISEAPLSADEVIEAGAAAAEGIGNLLRATIEAL